MILRVLVSPPASPKETILAGMTQSGRFVAISFWSNKFQPQGFMWNLYKRLGISNSQLLNKPTPKLLYIYDDQKVNKMKSKLFFTAILTFLFGIVRAQQPDLLPPVKTEPIELTPFNIILYIVMPVLIFLIYFWYRKSKRKK